MAGSQVTPRGRPASVDQLAGDVLDPRERLRQVDLQRVGAAIVGDQAGAGIDRDEEDEDALLIEELAERLRVGARNDACAMRRRDVDLHGAHEERRPREQQQTEEAPLREDAPGCRRARSPTRRGRAAPLRRRSDDSPGRESAWPLHVLARRRARTRLRASARSAADAAPACRGRAAQPKQQLRRRGAPGTNTRMTSSSVAVALDARRARSDVGESARRRP